MRNQNKQATLSAANRAWAGVENIGDVVEQELGYVRSILHAIAVLANQDAETNKLEIVSLANCAAWVSENLESNVDHFGSEIMQAVGEVKNG